MTKIFVTFPTDPSNPYIHKQVVFVSWKLLSDKRYNLTPIIPSHRPYENNLHYCIRQFIREGYDYWLNIDSDNPPINNPLDLVQFDKDIIGFPTPVWHFTGQKSGERPIYWTGYDYVPKDDAYKEHNPKEGLQPVDAIGTGCFLIAKRVFEKPEMQKGAFTRKLYKDGRVNKGNDLSFSERATKHGFKIYCHYDYPCMHFCELELNEVITAFMKLKNKT